MLYHKYNPVRVYVYFYFSTLTNLHVLDSIHVCEEMNDLQSFYISNNQPVLHTISLEIGRNKVKITDSTQNTT